MELARFSNQHNSAFAAPMRRVLLGFHSGRYFSAANDRASVDHPALIARKQAGALWSVCSTQQEHCRFGYDGRWNTAAYPTRRSNSLVAVLAHWYWLVMQAALCMPAWPSGALNVSRSDNTATFTVSRFHCSTRPDMQVCVSATEALEPEFDCRCFSNICSAISMGHRTPCGAADPRPRSGSFRPPVAQIPSRCFFRRREGVC